MAAIISIESIDEAIANLGYRSTRSLKYQLLHTIRNFHAEVDSVESIEAIDTDVIIREIWQTGHDSRAIKNKRKNLSSIKSTVNADLRKLYQNGKNPQGVVIGPSNIFVMSDEAKDQFLSQSIQSVAGDQPVSLDQITTVLDTVNELLASLKASGDVEDTDASNKLANIKRAIQNLSQIMDFEVAPDFSEKDLAEASTQTTVDRGSGEREEVDGLSTASLGSDHHLGLGPGQGEPDKVEELVPEEPFVDEVVEDEDDLEELIEDDAEITDAAEELEEVLAVDADELEDPEGSEEFDDDMPEEDFEELDLAEQLVDLDDIGDLEEEFGEDLSEVEAVDDLGAGQGDGALEYEGSAALQQALPDDEKLPNYFFDSDHKKDDLIRKAKLLAEEFNSYLGARERFFNQFIQVPAGDYVVGSKEPQKEELPERKVYLDRFYLGRFPVTNSLFEVFVEKTGYITSAEKLGYSTVYHGRIQKAVDERTGMVRLIWGTLRCKTVRGARWYQPSGPGSNLHNKRNHPVVQVSLEDALAFAAWTGKGLPTADEWEAAARTARGNLFPWGDDWIEDSCNLEASLVADTTAVDKYMEFANGFGIADTLGNVLEWTADRCEPASSVKTNSNPYVVKGGSWISPDGVQLSSRFRVEAKSPSNTLGFRCVAY